MRERTGALLERHGLPTRLGAEVATPAVMAAIGRDKKVEGDAQNMVLLAAPGDVRLGMTLRPARAHRRGGGGAARLMLRIALLHGPNLDMLGRRPSEHYGTLTLRQLEDQVRAWGAERDMSVSCFQTNHEGAFLEHVHGLAGAVDGAVVNPGAWTHYQWSIRDALELLDAPFVEVHLSDVEAREPHRTVLGDPRHRRRRDLGPRPGGLPRRPRPAAGAGRVREAGRQEAVLQAIAGRGLGALLVTDLANVRYLTGYVGSNGIAVIGPRGRTLLTDSRYAVAAREQARGVDVVIGRRDLLGDAAAVLPGAAGDGPVGVEAESLTLARHGRLQAMLEGTTLEPTAGIVEALREVKDPEELEAMREAAAVAERALAAVLERGIVGRTEREVAFALHGAMLEEGAERPSFETIVAAGPRGSRPTPCPGPTPSPRTPWSRSTSGRSFTATAPT